MRIFGVVLIVVGIAMMIFTGFNFTEKEKVVDIGPLEITKENEKHVGWPTYAGGIVAVAGVALLISGLKKKS